MAISPMDMQTMYTAVDKVANAVTHQTQGMGVAKAIQGDVQARQDTERRTAVGEIGDNGDATAEINKDSRGHGGSGAGDEQKKRGAGKTSAASGTGDASFALPRDYRVGRHVDVSG